MKKHKKPNLKNTKDERIRIKKYAQFAKTNFDWDYGYIIDLILFKIKRVKVYMLENSHINNDARDKIVNEIKEAEFYLQRVVNDEYFTSLLDEFEAKYGEIKSFTKKIENGNYSFESDWSAIEPDKLEEAKIAYFNISEKEKELRKADLKKAFDLMVENIWDWWD